jgi:hypothetical protein
MSQDSQSGFTPEKLQLFIAGLSGLSGDETRKAKILFLKNAVSHLRATKASSAGFAVAQGCFAIIPVFWPILWAQRAALKSELLLQKEQIHNALQVWRADIGEEARQIERELEAL